jgi:hypothetical protein
VDLEAWLAPPAPAQRPAHPQTTEPVPEATERTLQLIEQRRSQLWLLEEERFEDFGDANALPVQQARLPVPALAHVSPTATIEQRKVPDFP